MSEKITKILKDAVSKHNLVLDINDKNIKDLVAYVLHIGYCEGWKDRNNEIEENG
jgi:hypothetical protein